MMSQRLILPISDCQINAGYKSSRYKNEWGYTHYGVDLGSVTKNRAVHGMGNGTVIACGMDGATERDRLGICVVIVYQDILTGTGKQLPGVACRMFHYDRIYVKAGDKISSKTIIGEYGNTGANTTGPHLHVEFDADWKNPQYAYGLEKSGNIIRQGTIDSTIDPCTIFWRGEGQDVTAYQSLISEGWISAESASLPRITDANASDYQQLQSRLDDEIERRTAAEKTLDQLRRNLRALLG